MGLRPLARPRRTGWGRREPLNVEDYPRRIDRYRALDGPGHARILRAALARREEYRDFSGFDQYMVRHQEPEIDEAAFLRIVAAFVFAWRRKVGIAPVEG